MRIGSQGGNCLPQSSYFLAKVNDFHLNYCILKENAKNTTSGSTPHPSFRAIIGTFLSEADIAGGFLISRLFDPGKTSDL
jgi:hypothetical protein